MESTNNTPERDGKLTSCSAIIYVASCLMSSADTVRMAELKAEYCKLSTSPARMRKIYAEMKALRSKVMR